MKENVEKLKRMMQMMKKGEFMEVKMNENMGEKKNVGMRDVEKKENFDMEIDKKGREDLKKVEK